MSRRGALCTTWRRAVPLSLTRRMNTGPQHNYIYIYIYIYICIYICAWRKVQIFNFQQSYMADRRHLTYQKTALMYFVITQWHIHNFDNKTPNINTKNCSLSIVLTATDQKPQKSLRRWYYSISRWHSGDVLVGNITCLLIFCAFWSVAVLPLKFDLGCLP